MKSKPNFLKRRGIRLFLVALFVSSLLFGFQNCGGSVSLSPTPSASTLPPRFEPNVTLKVCSQTDASEGRETFRINPIVAMNLNTKIKYKDGVLVLAADSDIDGLTDDEDENKTQRVQEGLLETICKAAGGAGCNTTSCTVSRRHFGLSNCDKTELALSPDFAKQDFDKDLAPDFLEILYGLLPKQRDTNPDNDSMQTVQEFSVGRNPMVADNETPEGALFESKRVLSEKKRTEVEFGCPVNQELWSLSLEKMPLVETLEFIDDARAGDVFDFSHEKNENIILFYFYSRNLSTSKTEIKGALIKVKVGQKAISLSPADFHLIGRY